MAAPVYDKINRKGTKQPLHLFVSVIERKYIEFYFHFVFRL